jgi:epoxyqueuosine reductase QueG
MEPINAEEVKDFVLNRDIDFVGIAPVERFAHAPKNRRPTDLLPEAKSVIVIGLHILFAVGRAGKLAYSCPEMSHARLIHRMFGYMHLNRVMDWTNHQLARLLERKGYLSLPIPASPPNEFSPLFGVFSNRHAAVAAGLGELGWNGLLITPQVGPRLRVASLITEAELKPDPMYRGKLLCDREKCHDVCVVKCPTQAFSTTETVKAIIGDREFEYARLKKRKCMLSALDPYPPANCEPGEIPDDPSAEDWSRIIAKYGNRWRAMESSSIGRGAPACRCQYECPVGQA